MGLPHEDDGIAPHFHGIENAYMPPLPFGGWIPMPLPLMTYFVRVKSTHPINVPMLAESSSLPIDTLQKMIDGTYKSQEINHADMLEAQKSNKELLQKLFIGLLKYKYSDKANIIDALLAVDKKMPDISHYQPPSIETIGNIDTCMQLLDSIHSVIALIKLSDLKTPFNLDEFSVEEQYGMNQIVIDSMFHDVYYDIMRSLFRKIFFLIERFGIVLFAPRKYLFSHNSSP
jgi:hypothetical protein